MLTVEGFRFEPPPSFRTEEVTVGLRGEAPAGTAAPSLIVQSRPARAGASLEELAGETIAELAQSLGGMRESSRAEFAFADGGTGIVLAYTFQTGTGPVRQYYVLRLHAERLCTMTLTLPKSALDENAGRVMLAAIASLAPA